jgi:hypothetical protein
MTQLQELSVPIERVGRYLRFRWNLRRAVVPAEQARQKLQDYFTRDWGTPPSRQATRW